MSDRSPRKETLLADSAVEVSLSGPELLGTGRFWHDRRPRREYLTGRLTAQQDFLAGELWDKLAAMTPEAAS